MKGGGPTTELPTTGALRQYAAACSASLMVMTTGCWLGWPSPAIPKLEHHETALTVTDSQISWMVSLMFSTVPLTVAASLMVMTTGCWLGWPSPAIPKLEHHETALTVTDSQISWMVSLMDAGSAVSPVPAGILMDVVGRKVVLLLAGLAFTVSWLMALLASSPGLLYVARFLAGACKGVAFTVAPMYLGEIASTGIRGAVSTMFAGLLWAGTMFEFGIGPFVSYDLLIMMSLSVPALFLLTFVFMPESPYYLVMKGRDDDAKKSLKWLRDSPDVAEESGTQNPVSQELKLIQKTVSEDMQNKSSFVDLVSTQGNKRATTIVVIISMFQRTCGISPLLAYSSTTLPQTRGFIGPSEIIVVFGLILTFSNFLATPLVDRLGRRPLLIFSGAGCGVATGVTAVFYYLQHKTHVDVSGWVWVPYVCICVFGLTHSIGIGVIPHTLLAELYPQNVKCYAAAVAAITFALSSFAINKVYTTVAAEVGVHAMFAFFSLNGLVCALFSYYVVFETKGKTFAEIQSVLKEKR